MDARLAAAFLCGALVLGCGPTFAPAVMVEKASSSPFRGQRRFVMLPVQQTRNAIGKYVDVKNGRRIEVHGDTVETIETAFAPEVVARAAELGITVVLADDAPAGAYVIRPVIETLDAAPGGLWVDPQTHRRVMTGVQLRIYVEAPDGQKDEFLVTERRPYISTSQGAQLCAQSAVEYLRGRVSGER